MVLLGRDWLGKAYNAIDRGNLPLSVATNKASELPYGDHARITQWLSCFGEQLLTASGAFGL